MTLTDKHIENAHVLCRLELAGASVNKIAKECGVTRATIWNWSIPGHEKNGRRMRRHEDHDL